MPNITDALSRLRDHDPAANLPPLSTIERAAIHDQVAESSWSDQAGIAAATVVGSRRWRAPLLGGLLRRGPLVPVVVVLVGTTAVAAAATALVPLLNVHEFARQNAKDAALTLFRKSDPFQGGNMVDGTLVPNKETVIPSSVRRIARTDLPGIGAVQFWVADTKQHGYCTALRLPDGSWAGLQNEGNDGGTVPGCEPTRRQDGWGVLIISGFDYTNVGVTTSDGQRRSLIYGQIVAPGDPTEVRDESTGATGPVIDGKYFMLDASFSGGDDTHLVALNAAGTVVADEKKPLPGTPTVKCVGRYDVRHYRIPGTKRTTLGWDCHRYVHTIAK